MFRRDEQHTKIISELIETNKKLITSLTVELVAVKNELRQFKLSDMFYTQEDDTLS